MYERERECVCVCMRERESVCVCVYARERERECVCVYERDRECVCVHERERECVCVCVYERERERERERVYERERVCVFMLTMNTHRKDRNGDARILYALNTNTALLQRKLFYHSHISPHLTYASTVWDGCSDILVNKLNSLHRRAAKLMISDSSLTTAIQSYSTWDYFHSKKSLSSIRQC